ncbi:MAG: TfoX/Sxy family protein [Marmoricola sp.]
MAYDEALAADIRMELSGESGVTEKKMFGGLGFMINGNMAVAANASGGMMVRVSPELASTLLAPPNVDLFDMGGRRMESGHGHGRRLEAASGWACDRWAVLHADGFWGAPHWGGLAQKFSTQATNSGMSDWVATGARVAETHLQRRVWHCQVAGAHSWVAGRPRRAAP